MWVLGSVRLPTCLSSVSHIIFVITALIQSRLVGVALGTELLVVGWPESRWLQGSSLEQDDPRKVTELLYFLTHNTMMV